MMKKIILCLTLALMTATTVFAAKAKPGITQLQCSMVPSYQQLSMEMSIFRITRFSTALR